MTTARPDRLTGRDTHAQPRLARDRDPRPKVFAATTARLSSVTIPLLGAIRERIR